METTINYKLEQALEILKVRAEKMDWSINGQLPTENDYTSSSQTQAKKIQRAINRIVKKGTRRNFNRLFYLINKNGYAIKVNIELGIKERAIQRKRKEWKLLQAQADVALKAYKEEKGMFYKDKM
jgi:predicted Zn-dependent protease